MLSFRTQRSNRLFCGALAVLMAACNQTGPDPVGVSPIDSDVETVALKATPASPNSAILSWDDVPNPNIRGYRVYYGPDPDTYLQLPGQGIDAGKVTTYTINGLTSARRYYFAVTAVDYSGNESDYSKQVFKDIP